MQSIAHYQSPIGPITLAGNENGLTGLWFDGQKYFAASLPESYEEKNLPVFVQTKRWLTCYFRGESPDFMPPLHLEGTPFRLAVWEILRQIPFGKTMTYGEIAGILARQRGLASLSAQAVGGAVAHNPISIIVPCHRVVGSNGSLTGYAGGIDRKIKLLALEHVDQKGFFVPAKSTAG